jgi:hypothetical protein
MGILGPKKAATLVSWQSSFLEKIIAPMTDDLKDVTEVSIYRGMTNLGHQNSAASKML